MILVDTNTLLVLILGLIDPELIDSHKRTSIYEAQDFYDLMSIIQDLNRLLILPNIMTEVDNLLNRSRSYVKERYILHIRNLLANSSEIYVESLKALNQDYFYDLGLTDSLILETSDNYDLLITSDSSLSDWAKANGIQVYDLVQQRNKRLIDR